MPSTSNAHYASIYNDIEETSWDDGHFTAANIPWGIASSITHPSPEMVTRLYHNVYYLTDLVASKLIFDVDPDVTATFSERNLNAFAALPKSIQLAIRAKLHGLFNTTDVDVQSSLSQCAQSVSSVTMYVPVGVGDFSDFSTSISHVLNAGEAVLGHRSLPPGFLHFPVGYAGRSSSIVISGTSIPRPSGITRDRVTGAVSFGPSAALDFELEVAVIVSKSTRLGERVKMEDVDSHVFGLVLLNDWSARDIQGFEMNPLGPFNGKSFGTTISPWVVTLEALKPFEVSSNSVMPTLEELNSVKLNEIPPRSDYLCNSKPLPHYDINLRVDLTAGGKNKPDGCASLSSSKSTTTVCQSNLSTIYWSLSDILVHQTISGCPLNVGDVLATGTISGSSPDSYGCLLEKTRGGKLPFKLNDGTERRYLEDGDNVLMTGWAGREGSENCVGFGACWGRIVASWEKIGSPISHIAQTP